MRYVVVVDGKPGAYGVVVPDFPGCTSGGDSIEEALHNVIEAMSLWAEAAHDAGETLPQPRSVEALRKDPDVAETMAEGGMFATAPLLLETGRPAKANISLDAGLLAAIDEAAAALGLTRSAFLASAARAKIADAY